MTSPPTNDAGADSAREMLDRAKRLGMYAFWTAAGLVIALGLDRLIVCPALNRELGDRTFGAFLWVFGVVNLIGSVAANGFAVVLMRDLARQGAAGGRGMMRTALVLSIVFSTALLLVASLVAWRVSDDAVRADSAALFGPLILYALLRSIGLLLLTDLRIRRRFKIGFVLKLVEACVLLGVLLVADSRSLWAIGLVYVVSVLLPLPIAWASCPRMRGPGAWYDAKTSRMLLSRWSGGALMTLADQSQVYAPRVALGILAATEHVAVLYAGTSIGNIFVLPVGMLGNLVLSLLGGQTKFVLGGRRGGVYFAVVCGLAAVVGVLSYGIGRWLIRMLYPDLAPETLQFFHWIAVANGCAAMTALFRPVSVKYLPLRNASLISLVAAVGQVLLLAVLVPLAGAVGAAQALAASSGMAAGLWMMSFFRACRLARVGHAP